MKISQALGVVALAGLLTACASSAAREAHNAREGEPITCGEMFVLPDWSVVAMCRSTFESFTISTAATAVFHCRVKQKRGSPKYSSYKPCDPLGVGIGTTSGLTGIIAGFLQVGAVALAPDQAPINLTAIGGLQSTHVGVKNSVVSKQNNNQNQVQK